jgi:hypothetical protein
MSANTPSLLSDSDLIIAVNRLAQSERRTTVDLIGHLAELDARRLYLGAGFSSLFTYCTEVLRLSEHEAYNRIEAARAARRFPILLGLLEEGRLNLTTVRLLGPHLTPENHQELVAAAADKSKREVEELLARRFPQPAVASSVRRLPATPRPPNAAAVPVDIAAAPVAPPSAPIPEPPPAVLPTPPARRPSVNPLATDRYAIRFTASAATCEKLRLAQDLLRHVVPDGDPAAIFDRALDGAAGGPGEEEARGGEAAGPGSRPLHLVPPRPGTGEALGLAAGRRPLRVPLTVRAAVLRARLPRVPSRGAVCRGRRGHRGEHPAPLSCSQRLRGRALLRVRRPLRGRRCRQGTGRRNSFQNEFRQVRALHT